jgi:hypothetical protein
VPSTTANPPAVRTKRSAEPPRAAKALVRSAPSLVSPRPSGVSVGAVERRRSAQVRARAQARRGGQPGERGRGGRGGRVRECAEESRQAAVDVLRVASAARSRAARRAYQWRRVAAEQAVMCVYWVCHWVQGQSENNSTRVQII